MEEIKLYGGKVKILFDDQRHRFTNAVGEPISSVTSFTGVLDKPALIYWAVKMMGLHLEKNWDPKKVNTEEVKMGLIETAKKEFRRIKEEAADIGTDIHQFAEDYIKGKKPKMPEQEETKNGVIAFLDWFKGSGIKITSSERFIYSKKHNYAGIEDWEGTEGKSLVIGDFKSSKGIYDEMRFQLALYWNAREEETGKEYDKGLIVKFGKQDGKFELLTIPRKEYLCDLKAALACIPIKRRLDQLKAR